MDIKEKMHNGELYFPNDEEIMKEQTLCLDRLYDFNHIRPTEGKKREEMLKSMFAEIGENCYIERLFMQIGAEGMFISGRMFMQISI